MSFTVGQKVVCIDDDAGKPYKWASGEAVVRGETYTVKRAFEHDGQPTVWLEEVERCDFAKELYGEAVGYATFRFKEC